MFVFLVLLKVVFPFNRLQLEEVMQAHLEHLPNEMILAIKSLLAKGRNWILWKTKMTCQILRWVLLKNGLMSQMCACFVMMGWRVITNYCGKAPFHCHISPFGGFKLMLMVIKKFVWSFGSAVMAIWLGWLMQLRWRLHAILSCVQGIGEWLLSNPQPRWICVEGDS